MIEYEEKLRAQTLRNVAQPYVCMCVSALDVRVEPLERSAFGLPSFDTELTFIGGITARHGQHIFDLYQKVRFTSRSREPECLTK